MNNKKFLLFGGWGYGNIGDEAILASTINNIYRVFPKSKLIVTSYSDKETRKHHDIGSVPSLHHIMSTSKFVFLKSIFSIYIWKSFRTKVLFDENLKEYFNNVEKSDAVIMAGGGYFNDVWKSAFITRYLEILITKNLKKPIFITGQTVGPFKNKIARMLIKNILKKVDLIAVRDLQSKEGLKELGLKKEIFVTSDEANNIKRVFDFKDNVNKPGNSFNIGLMVQKFRPYVSSRGVEQSVNRNPEIYYKSFAEIADTLVERYNSKIRLLPSTNWDEKECEKVISYMKYKSNVELYKDLTIKEYVSEISKNDIMISTNMHPLILSAAYGVPVIGISYWYKIDDFMSSIGQDTVWRIDDIKINEILSCVEKLLANRNNYSAQIIENSRKIRERADNNSDLILSYFNEVEEN